MHDVSDAIHYYGFFEGFPSWFLWNVRASKPAGRDNKILFSRLMLFKVEKNTRGSQYNQTVCSLTALKPLTNNSLETRSFERRTYWKPGREGYLVV